MFALSVASSRALLIVLDLRPSYLAAASGRAGVALAPEERITRREGSHAAPRSLVHVTEGPRWVIRVRAFSGVAPPRLGSVVRHGMVRSGPPASRSETDRTRL